MRTNCARRALSLHLSSPHRFCPSASTVIPGFQKHTQLLSILRILHRNVLEQTTILSPYPPLDFSTIMSTDPINANPTILNASELPTRRKQSPARHSRDDGFVSLFANPTSSSSSSSNFLLDPFVENITDSSFSSGSESEDDVVVEQIDEQEIYGMFTWI